MLDALAAGWESFDHVAKVWIVKSYILGTDLGPDDQPEALNESFILCFRFLIQKKVSTPDSCPADYKGNSKHTIPSPEPLNKH